MLKPNQKINLSSYLLGILRDKSCCHWCHVMEQESFEDEEVAQLLNEGFVAIKVDREERPDIDLLYMNVCQNLTGSGGWPLTVLLTPDRKPFFAGTYFPKRDRYGRPGLLTMLAAVREKWREDRERFERAGSEILDALAPRLEASQSGEGGPDLLKNCYRYLNNIFDPVYGGFGNAPKFPTPHHLLFLLRYWQRYHEDTALEMVEKTLLGMYCGGIFDHIGFGFSRYSTDGKWLVPHFEKMLYDNALLAYVYLEAYQATRKQFYARVAREIFLYILRDMASPEGGFYSAEDADSEGVEGKFYLWTPEKVKEVLGAEDGEYFCSCFGITKRGNFEGKNIPNLIGRRPGGYTAAQPPAENENIPPIPDERITAAREKLFSAREKRVHPFKDDKILTAWNGLMIAALARGAWVLEEEEYARRAEQAVRFLMSHLRSKDGRLLARYREGEAAFPGYLDDYAFLVWGLLELYQATFMPDYLADALELTGQMQELFWDREKGGFYFTGSDATHLPARPKEIYDGAIPSGNSVAALNLLRLARLTGNSKLEQSAAEQLRAFGGTVAAAPAGCTFYLCALDFTLGPGMDIVLAGERNAADTEELLNILRTSYLPRATSLLRPGGKEGEKLTRLAPFTADHHPVEHRATIYICQNYSCSPPVTDTEELKKLLKGA